MPLSSFHDFVDKVGAAFRVDGDNGAPVLLSLRACTPLSDSGRPGGSFRLEFIGPAQPHLPQSIYRFTLDGADSTDIFIVPVAAERGALVYEAIFY